MAELRINARGSFAIGTIKTVAVIDRTVVSKSKTGTKLVRPYEILTVVERGTTEAFVISHAGWHPQLKPGDTGIITWTVGGPLGAYWLFTPHAKEARRG